MYVCINPVLIGDLVIWKRKCINHHTVLYLYF